MLAAVKAAQALVAVQLPGEAATGDFHVARDWVSIGYSLVVENPGLMLSVQEATSLPAEAAKAGLVGPRTLGLR